MFSFASAFMAVLEPGDQVLLPDPGFPNYQQVARLLHAEPVFYPLDPSNGWLPPPPDELAELVTPRTKMLLLCSPGNPTGAVLSLPTLQRYADFAAARGLHLLSDEIYDKIVFNSPGTEERADQWGVSAAPSILQTDHDEVGMQLHMRCMHVRTWHVRP